MENEALDQHLSQITTAWTLLHQAHTGPGTGAQAAQQQLLQRYGRAAYRYLLAAVRNPDTADELFQELALRLVRGDFKHATRERGRFRDYLKRTLFHLIVDHQRREQKRPAPLDPNLPDPAAEPVWVPDADQQFLALWRAEVMDRAWEALAALERRSGQPLHTILRFRTDHPDLRAPEIAQSLTNRLGKTVTPVWVRKRLHVARGKFTDFLVAEVARSLEGADDEDVAQELHALGLLDPCRNALQRRQTDATAREPRTTD